MRLGGPLVRPPSGGVDFIEAPSGRLNMGLGQGGVAVIGVFFDPAPYELPMYYV